MTCSYVRMVKGLDGGGWGASKRVPVALPIGLQKVAVMCNSTAQCDRFSMTRVHARRAHLHAPLCALRTLCLITRF